MKTAIFTLALALAVPAAAQDASILAVSGKVTVLPVGQKKRIPAKPAMDLIEGDQVHAQKGSVAHVRFANGAKILLRENSILTIAGTTERAVAQFAFGEFLVGLGRRLSRRESFQVRTPAAVAAVRGTLFWGKSDETSKNATFAGFGHKIAVTASNKTVILKAGQVTNVVFGETPADPKAHDIKVDYLKNFAIDGSIESLDGLADKP